MLRRMALASLLMGTFFIVSQSMTSTAEAQAGQPHDWNRFNYYPYLYYPQNFQRHRSYDHMYYRYSPEMQIPVYRSDWYNFYPTEKPYHKGYHFILDVF